MSATPPTGRRWFVVAGDETMMVPLPDGDGRYRVPIDASVGCRNLIQRVLQISGPGRVGPRLNGTSEDVVFVVSGRGRAEVEARGYHLEPGVGLLVPPGATYAFENEGPLDLTLVSVLSPQPGFEGVPSPKAAPVDPDRLTVREADEATIPTGEDRFFKLMVDPRYGARYVTQFLGFIQRSRAPFHTHTYEECIFILGGDGRVHVDDRDLSIGPGTSIFLSPGTHHCLENRSREPLRLLGVFAPAGSPADHEDRE